MLLLPAVPLGRAIAGEELLKALCTERLDLLEAERTPVSLLRLERDPRGCERIGLLAPVPFFVL